ncbi:D-arabinose 5-phosphate isomerase [Odoribacter laneus]|jgi:sugar isomerase, kpsF/gutQ family|uniref:KpsF/GutQ family sugar isomerase n=1 Tax=Odoribacter laneus YIT 12061 TaxID=742817 RepID=H1DGQ3_9BACT|nr:KpsF/GutQ family sugar-phosphate isomerase [Odoribacter laneus]MBS1446518.1 KpsF/GutQ family sugar-phosphate isomerase [Odoribacter sp.]EHP47586.1 KpsF/GutQ family sugar isomerase [Odoribacter laneus YIT 12061]CCZ80605.1 kpsF/GutQ family sugar isomerase [Odoribacter laneus CAG:561]GKI20759.1 D-arabinose 5-phosphate isomerase [Odoribacter laneus]GKI24023.1 D-arabinose 5-phosphate isomerase [Odoribacter laneus]
MIDIKCVAKKVVSDEAEAVRNLLNYIDEDFEKVVKLIYESKGRVIITGIGKSAIIAQKIVATLNSTGTPAVFLHAADAIHGDMGMVQHEDVVIFVSKSGNTPEIKVLLPLIRNIGNNSIVAMVSNTDSFLAQNAEYVIKAKVDREACPNNLAPTNSTTAQLVMGDALAMCLIECRNFSSRDFARYHPGGSLGKRLYTRVSDVFDKENRPKVGLEDNIRKVILEMSGGCLGAVAVVDQEEKLIGIVTDGDLRRMLEKYKDVDGLKAADIMSASPKTIPEEELAYNAFRLMEKNSITQLVVTDDQRIYKGIVHLHDILKEGVV